MRCLLLCLLVLSSGFDPGLIADSFVSQHAIFHHGSAGLSDVFLSRELRSFDKGYASFLFTASSNIGGRRIDARFIVVVDVLSMRVSQVVVLKKKQARLESLSYL